MIAVHLVPFGGQWSGVTVDADKALVIDEQLKLYKDGKEVFGIPLCNLLYWQKADGPQ